MIISSENIYDFMNMDDGKWYFWIRIGSSILASRCILNVKIMKLQYEAYVQPQYFISIIR